jgi:hypothetical protein
MKTTTVQYRNRRIVPDDDEIDAFDSCVCGFTIGKLTPDGNLFDSLFVGTAHVSHPQTS